MENQNLAAKAKNLRNRKGFSQEQLAEESKLSLRTIQRIEKGETIPRGDTLVKLAQTLEVTPDDLLEWESVEDKGYLQLLNWSSLSFIINPILGIIIPLAMWILKRGTIKSVDDAGKKILNFQLTWTLTVYSMIIIANTIVVKEFYIPGNASLFLTNISFKNGVEIPSLILLSLFLFNIFSILYNVRRCQKGGKNKYIPAIKFLK